ncbi:MAG TPA: dTDP-4-dehydrorhamnose reductase [Nitrospiraceae bacterium]|nr:dTDP-4-dehydrorhamnose reductase [Nitrospiraceae bacterium]
MRILITGADGQLGHELQRALSNETLSCAVWPEFDLLSPDVGAQVTAARPDVVIHAAAYTQVDKAEEEPDQAMAVNADGTRRVAQAAARLGARFIYVSTDYVFDGTKNTPYAESDTPNPLNVYGRSKLQGERQALTHCQNAVVVRTSWLYGPHGHNFVKTIMGLAGRQPELRVVADQRGCPTYAADLAQAIASLLRVDLRGIVHAAGSGACTWYDFARAIVALMGSDVPIHPISTAEAKRLAARPAYTILANTVLAKVGITLPHWEDALARFINDQKVQVEVQAKE